MAGTGKKGPTVPRRGAARSVIPSAPEVKIGYSHAGMETLHAIEEELAAPGFSVTDAPQIEISETPAGRETMAAIAEDLAEAMRPRQNTLPYGDRISNAPGALAPQRSRKRWPTEPSAAEPGALDDSARAKADAAPQAGAGKLEIFELLTFMVRGHRLGELATEALRLRFVEEHLLARLPGGSLEALERVEVTPGTSHGSLTLRIWYRT